MRFKVRKKHNYKNIYFIILMIFQFMGLGINLAMHGKERIVKDNFWSNLIARIISITLLYFAVKTGF